MKVQTKFRSFIKSLRSMLLPVRDVEKHLRFITRRTARELNIESQMVTSLEESTVKAVHYLELSGKDD
jgi:hypothetical protein